MTNNELEKCQNDFVYFIENYCYIDNKPIKLKDYQLAFINWIKDEKRRKKETRL